MTRRGTRKQIIRVCSDCHSNETRWRQGCKRNDGTIGPAYPNWYLDGIGGWYCHACYMKNIISPTVDVATRKKRNAPYNTRRLKYKDKLLLLAANHKIGVCNLCRAVVGFDCQRTHMDHEKYDDSNPLAHTMEICPRCHEKKHREERKRKRIEQSRKGFF